jgi:hypothetical protein
MLLRFAREAYARLAVVEGRLEIEKIFFVKIKIRISFSGMEGHNGEAPVGSGLLKGTKAAGGGGRLKPFNTDTDSYTHTARLLACPLVTT